METNRRTFLKTTAALFGGFFVEPLLASGKSPLLSFSTLGCPDWNFQQIVEFASSHRYTGIEVRGIMRQLDLTQCPEFSSKNLASTLRVMEDRNLEFVNLGSSATLHFPESAERTKNLDEGKRFIDLAHQLHCPYIRVFPNLFPKERDKKVTMDLITHGLLELGDHAKGSDVSVLIESHGDLTVTADIEQIMRGAKHEHTGMIWDVTNMWVKTKEAPALVFSKLKEYIRHTHIKDARLAADKVNYVLMGKGEVPIFEAIDVLEHGGYSGYYSFEWEKLWHPEIEDPSIALADYPESMRNHIR